MKKQLTLLLICLSSILQAQPSVNSILELINLPKPYPKTVNVTGYHKGVFFGGGTFNLSPIDQFSPMADRVNVFPTSAKDSLWIRNDMDGRLNPLNAGAIGEPNIRLAVRYTDSDVVKLYGYAIALNTLMDQAAIQHCCKAQDSIGGVIWFDPQFIYFTEKEFTMPAPLKLPNGKMIYVIEQNGAIIKAINGCNVWVTMPKDIQQSQDFLAGRRFDIRNPKIIGNGTGTGIKIGGGYQTSVTGGDFRNLDTAVAYFHCMSCDITSCNAIGMSSVAYHLGNLAEKVSGDPANGGSNGARVELCRNFTGGRVTATGETIDQFAAVSINRSSETRVIDLSLDGGQNRFLKYGVYNNTQNMTVVKSGDVTGIHGETGIDSALVKIRAGGAGNYTVNELFVQFLGNRAGVCLELEAMAGNAMISSKEWSLFPLLFRNIGNGSYDFTNVFGPQQKPTWVTTGGGSTPVATKVRSTPKVR